MRSTCPPERSSVLPTTGGAWSRYAWAVKEYGAPYYITSLELISFLRTAHGGRNNWLIEPQSCPEWGLLGRGSGGKTRFLKWHGHGVWTPGAYKPPAGKKRNGKTMEALAVEAIRNSPRRELSAKGVSGYIKRTYPGTSHHSHTVS